MEIHPCWPIELGFAEHYWRFCQNRVHQRNRTGEPTPNGPVQLDEPPSPLTQPAQNRTGPSRPLPAAPSPVPSDRTEPNGTEPTGQPPSAAVPPPPLQDEERVGPLRDPQSPGQQNLLRFDPHVGPLRWPKDPVDSGQNPEPGSVWFWFCCFQRVWWLYITSGCDT